MSSHTLLQALVALRTTSGETALHWAASGTLGSDSTRTAVVQLLLDAGAAVSVANVTGDTPLALATAAPVQALLQAHEERLRAAEESADAAAKQEQAMAAATEVATSDNSGSSSGTAVGSGLLKGAAAPKKKLKISLGKKA
jgi:ankyrin repeat protein